VWKCDSIALEADSADLVFTKVDSFCSKDARGCVSLSAQKKYALLSGSNSVVLWNIEKGEPVLATEFADPIDPSKRAVLTGAINPDGNSIILAFEDKVKIFKILLNKFKFCG
jgi:hypothetical protein